MFDRVIELFGHLASPPYIYYVAGVVVLVAILYLSHRYRRANRPIVPFRAQGGDVEIAPQTIRGLINGAAGRVPGVEHASCQYRQKGRKLRVRVLIHLQAAARLVQVQEEIKRRIRSSLQSQIGMEPQDVDPIRIKVTKILGEANPLLEAETLPGDTVKVERFDNDVEEEVPEGQGPYRT